VIASSGLVEGVQTCGVLNNLSNSKGIEMPIASAVDAVLAERISIDEAIEALMARPTKAEEVDFT
jgi:glycerol-3-phosphate dehydrogenase (NAD(P)+)